MKITVTRPDEAQITHDATNAVLYPKRGRLEIRRGLTTIARYDRNEWASYAVEAGAQDRPGDPFGQRSD